VCGNGIVEAGEQCDAGSSDPKTDCCTSVCTYLPVKSTCSDAKLPRRRAQCNTKDRCRKNASTGVISCKSGKAKADGTHCGGVFSKKTCQSGVCTL